MSPVVTKTSPRPPVPCGRRAVLTAVHPAANAMQSAAAGTRMVTPSLDRGGAWSGAPARSTSDPYSMRGSDGAILPARSADHGRTAVRGLPAVLSPRDGRDGGG